MRLLSEPLELDEPGLDELEPGVRGELGALGDPLLRFLSPDVPPDEPPDEPLIPLFPAFPGFGELARFPALLCLSASLRLSELLRSLDGTLLDPPKRDAS